MRHAIYVPLFGSLSDPHAVVDIGVALEESGWDGLIVETRQRARLLDEGVELLVALWKGDTVNDRGMLVAENVRAIPGPVQQPRIPIWFGSTRVDGAPIERPARYDGVFPDGVDASGIAQTDKAA